MKLLLFLRKVFTSRLGLTLGFLNLALCIYALINRPPADVDIAYESWLFIVLLILNLPSLFFSLIPSFLFAYILISIGYEKPPNKIFQDWLPVMFFLICAMFQWTVIGYGIESFFRRREKLKVSKLS